MKVEKLEVSNDGTQSFTVILEESEVKELHQLRDDNKDDDEVATLEEAILVGLGY